MTKYATNEFIAFYFRDERTGEARLRQAREQIEEHTPYRVCDSWLSPSRRLGILNLCSTPPQSPVSGVSRLKNDWLRALPTTNRLRVRGRLAVVQTGYTTTADRRFERSIRETPSGLVCRDAGGLAAFCVARFGPNTEETLYFWSTRPSIRPIASAETPEMIVVGTRPRLVHALTRDFGTPDLDHAYLYASLIGWSIGDETPYRGTTLLSVDALWRVRGGERTQHAHPTPPHIREPRIFRRQLPLFCAALREAVEPLRALSGFEIRLSGGKDSRAVAAAVFDRRILPSTAICQGVNDAPEVVVAKKVAETLGWELKHGQPIPGYRGGLQQTVRYNLALSDGFFATEPRHAAFPIHSVVGDVGPGLVMGHMSLQKGGWARQDEAREHAVERCRGRVARRRDFVVPEITESTYRQVDEYVATLDGLAGDECGYWINYRFRVGRWLTSHCLSHSRERLLVYPMVDEKVTRIFGCAPLAHLVSERLLAQATWALAPPLRDVSLLGPDYVFIQKRLADEAAKRKASAPKSAQGSAAKAKTSPKASKPAPVTDPGRDAGGNRFPAEDLAAQLCAHVRAGKWCEELRTATQKQVWAIIEEPTHARMRESRLPALQIHEYLYTCYQASVLRTDGLDW